MGMNASYVRISTDFLSYIKSHPEKIEDVVFENEELEEQGFDLNKAWHGIYYLLTGIADLEQPIESTLGLAIFGGTEIGEDLGYGPLRYLESAEVKMIADSLKSVSIEEFASRYEVEDIRRHNIYPLNEHWTTEDKEYLIENFEALVAFYHTAAEQEEAMLLFIT